VSLILKRASKIFIQRGRGLAGCRGHTTKISKENL